ncbi:hypothetical protein ACODH8_10040 [Vagococcus fluvialis]
MTRKQALEKAFVVMAYYEKSDDYEAHLKEQRKEKARGVRK